MAERRLNLNTPLLSVRRNSSSGSLSSMKGRTVENSQPWNNQRTIFASRYVDRSGDPATEPVSVPFTWEQVPGRAKDDSEHEPLPAGPVIVARNSVSLPDDCSEKGFGEGSATNEDAVYSAAVDMLSPTGSVSIGYSVSSLSGSDGPVMKRSGTFSVDKQTRDLMMGRFLPASRAMAMASESSLRDTLKNQPLLLTEQSDEVEKPSVSAIENRTPSRQHNMEIVQYFTQALPQAESSEEEEVEATAAAGNDDRSRYNSVPGTGCGLLPQLCIRSSLRLLNPVPGLKSRIRNSMPFVPAIRKDSKDESNSQSALKPVLCLQSGGPLSKSEYQVGAYKLEGSQIKPPGRSNRLNFSGDLRKIGRLSPFRSRRNDVATVEKTESPQPAYVVPPLGGSRRVNLSGELRPMTRKSSPFRSSRNDSAIFEKNESPRSSHVVPPVKGSGRVNFSGELRSTSGLSPFRPPRIDSASSRVNFSGELRTTGRLSPFRPSRNDAAAGLPQPSYVVPTLGGLSRHNFSGELRMTSQLSQPSYVVPPVGWSTGRNFSGELQPPRRPPPLRPPRNHSTTLPKNESNVMSSNKVNGCVQPVSPAFERTLYVDKVTTGRSSCSDSNSLNCEAWMDPAAEEIPSFRDIECLKVETRGGIQKEVDNGVLDPSLPLPSLRSPSQSWLWRTLPSVGSRSRFPSPQKTAPLSSTKGDSDTCCAGSKWEAIVKASKTYQDHTRHSKELIEHASRQCKS